MIGDVHLIKIDGISYFLKEVFDGNVCEGCFLAKPGKDFQLCRKTGLVCQVYTKFIEITEEEFRLFSSKEQIEPCEFCLDEEHLWTKLNIPADEINYCPVCGKKLK